MPVLDETSFSRCRSNCDFVSSPFSKELSEASVTRRRIWKAGRKLRLGVRNLLRKRGLRSWTQRTRQRRRSRPASRKHWKLIRKCMIILECKVVCCSRAPFFAKESAQRQNGRQNVGEAIAGRADRATPGIPGELLLGLWVCRPAPSRYDRSSQTLVESRQTLKSPWEKNASPGIFSGMTSNFQGANGNKFYPNRYRKKAGTMEACGLTAGRYAGNEHEVTYYCARALSAQRSRLKKCETSPLPVFHRKKPVKLAPIINLHS